MQLFSFIRPPEKEIHVGALSSLRLVIDLGAEARRRNIPLSFDPTEMLSLIAAGEKSLAEVQSLVEGPENSRPHIEDVRLLAPIPAPRRNVHCVGWNYVEHFEEGRSLRDSGQTLPEHPVFFTKGTNAVNGPYDPIPYDPRVSTAIDWEVELAVIVGRRGKNLTEEVAMDHVFGFCVLNDTTARDIQQKKHGYKTEVIRRRGRWRNIDEVEFATLKWVDWFNNQRLLEPLGYVPPAEYEAGLLSQSRNPSRSGWTQLSQSPENPGRFKMAREA